MGFVAGDHENIPEVQAAIARILAACKAAGKLAGMFCTSGEQIIKRHEQGCASLPTREVLTGCSPLFAPIVDFMNLGFDIVAIGAWNASELAKISHLR